MFCTRFPQLTTQSLTHVRQPRGVGTAAAMTRPPLLHRHRITPPWLTPPSHSLMMSRQKQSNPPKAATGRVSQSTTAVREGSDAHVCSACTSRAGGGRGVGAKLVVLAVIVYICCSFVKKTKKKPPLDLQLFHK